MRSRPHLLQDEESIIAPDPLVSRFSVVANDLVAAGGGAGGRGPGVDPPVALGGGVAGVAGGFGGGAA